MAGTPMMQTNTRDGAFEDAEFEMVGAPSHPAGEHPPAQPAFKANALKARQARPVHAQPAETSGLGIFRDPGETPRPQDDRIAFYGFGSILVALSFWVSGGHALFASQGPAARDMMTTSAISTPGTIQLVDTAWRLTGDGSDRALMIEGVVRNTGDRSGHAGPVTVRVRDETGATRSYLLGSKGWTLGPGREVVVAGRLDTGSLNIASVELLLSP
jgi:hypothetical protein